MTNFWEKLPRPFLVQAPMEQVTDTVVRQMLLKAGAPDVFFTEFTNVDGICSQGSEHVMKRLLYTDTERPLVAQIWGLDPENYYKSAKIISEMGFDGIDINMGCPDREVLKKGCCAALIDDHSRAKEIIQATQEGAKSHKNNIPVSVKTRIGVKSIKTEEWISFLLEHDLPALTIHGRTAAEMSKVPAHWDEIGKAVTIRDTLKKDTLIIGNGDIQSRDQALQMHEQYGVDGIMIGRGIFYNFWVFNSHINPEDISIKDRLAYLEEHIRLYDKTWGNTKDFNISKKFYKVYISGFKNASEIRENLMQFKNAPDTLEYLEELKKEI